MTRPITHKFGFSGTSKMAPLSTHETTILNLLWNNHGYFVDKTYSYCQALIAWAIEESKFTLNREKIRVKFRLLKLLI